MNPWSESSGQSQSTSKRQKQNPSKQEQAQGKLSAVVPAPCSPAWPRKLGSLDSQRLLIRGAQREAAAVSAHPRSAAAQTCLWRAQVARALARPRLGVAFSTVPANQNYKLRTFNIFVTVLLAQLHRAASLASLPCDHW